MKIVIQIERLVLDGIPANAADRARIRASVEGELTRLIGTGGLGERIRSGGAIPGARAPDFHYRKESPRATGEQIARSVYGSLQSRR